MDRNTGEGEEGCNDPWTDVVSKRKGEREEFGGKYDMKMQFDGITTLDAWEEMVPL